MKIETGIQSDHLFNKLQWLFDTLLKFNVISNVTLLSLLMTLLTIPFRHLPTLSIWNGRVESNL